MSPLESLHQIIGVIWQILKDHFGLSAKNRLPLLSLSVLSDCATSWTVGCQASLPFTISWSLLKLTFINSVLPTKHLMLLSSPINLSQHQGLFQWVDSSHQVAKVLEFQLQHQSSQWKFRVDFLKDWLVWFSCSPRDSQEPSPAPQFKSISSLVLSLLYGPALTPTHDYWEKPKLWLNGPLSAE